MTSPARADGKAIPYGIYDLAADAGWVNVGTDRDTAAFAVESIRRWWHGRGRLDYPGARRLLITADAGGSNGYRTRAWKTGPGRPGPGDRAGDHLLPLPARHVEVEQDRAPAVQPHHHELARPSPGQPRDHREQHRRHHHRRRPDRARRARRPAPTRPGSRSATAELDALPAVPHYWHGEWNYTLLPAPAAAPRPRPRRPARGPPGPGLARPSRRHRHDRPRPGRPDRRPGRPGRRPARGRPAPTARPPPPPARPRHRPPAPPDPGRQAAGRHPARPPRPALQAPPPPCSASATNSPAATPATSAACSARPARHPARPPQARHPRATSAATPPHHGITVPAKIKTAC